MAKVKYGALELVPSPLVGINVQSKFFGADIRYALTKTYSLRGTLLSSITSGISGLSIPQQAIVTGFAQDYLPFSIDDKIIGYPKVGNVSFDNGTWVQKNGYSIDLEFLESGNPFQTTGSYYNLTGVSGLFHQIESLSETLEYNNDFKSYNRTHSVEIQMRTGVDFDPLLNAKIIASGLLNNAALFPFVASGGVSGITVYEERQNVFDGTYSVSERFKGTTGNTPYDHRYSLSLRLENNGITTVTQNGTIRGLGQNKYIGAKDGFNAIQSDIYPNCSGFYGIYEVGTLNQTYFADRRTDNVNEGTISYVRSFNDETGIANVRWRYSHQITRENNTFSAVEKGEVVGMGHISQRFVQSSGYFVTNVEPGIQTRVLSEFSGFGGTGAMSLISKEKGFNRFEGSVNYAWEYSNGVGLGAGSGIKEFEVTVSDDLPIANRVYINAVGVGVLAQPLNSTKAGERTVTARIQAFRETSYPDRFDFMKNLLNSKRPLDSNMLDPFINSLECTYNPLESTLEARITYIYGGLKLDGDIWI